MFKRNATRAKLVAGAVLLSLGLSATGAAMATNVYGGGATLPAGGYMGWNFVASSPAKIFSSNVSSTSSGAATVATDSLIGHWASTTGNSVSYCQTGSGNGKKIFDHFDGSVVLIGATGACTGTTSGFGAASGAPVDPHFAGSDAPMSQQEFNWFTSGGKNTANTQPVQFPAIVGSVAIAYNNPDASSLNLTDAAVCRIFAGQVTNWNQLTAADRNLPSGSAALPSRALKLAFRSDGSGTTFSLANHLSTVCGSAVTTGHFVTDQSFAVVAAAFTQPTGSIGASGNTGVVSAIEANAGAIGYAEAGNLKNTSGLTATKVAQVNGFDPYANLPAVVSFTTTVLPDRVISGVNANGTPALATLTGGASSAAGCMLIVNPASYANIANQYPIIAVSNLIANNTGNGADVGAVQSLFSSLYGSTAHAGVNTVGAGADGKGTGYAFVNAPTAAAKVTSCIKA
ncbi:substrate-binding domain-containing protein [Luteibacter sp. CQ10]|uniref:substrate-binding domain-containing protein n=1 Tax=Luteibacter sp. CQ10 TaxID=2805821 RepID=UPI0034A3340A